MKKGSLRIIHAHGQTCNKFWIWANLIAEAHVKGGKVVVLIPDIVVKEYPNLQQNPIIRFPFFSRKIAKTRFYKPYIKFLNAIFGNKYSVALQKLVFGMMPWVSFYDLKPGDFKSEFKYQYQSALKRDFTPGEKIVTDCNRFIEILRAESSIILGLHIRYGDYRTFQHGKYFYSLGQYREKIEEFIRKNPGKSVSVSISTNEKIDMSAFEGLNVHSFKGGGATHDLYILSLCDYIIGPPSTFSAWASFMGDLPIYFIEDITEDICFKKMAQIWG